MDRQEMLERAKAAREKIARQEAPFVELSPGTELMGSIYRIEQFKSKKGQYLTFLYAELFDEDGTVSYHKISGHGGLLWGLAQEGILALVSEEGAEKKIYKLVDSKSAVLMVYMGQDVESEIHNWGVAKV